MIVSIKSLHWKIVREAQRVKASVSLQGIWQFLNQPETMITSNMAIPLSFTLNLSSCHYIFSEILVSETFIPYCYSTYLSLFWHVVLRTESSIFYHCEKLMSFHNGWWTMCSLILIPFSHLLQWLHDIASTWQCFRLLARAVCLKTLSCASDRSHKQNTFWLRWTTW